VEEEEVKSSGDSSYEDEEDEAVSSNEGEGQSEDDDSDWLVDDGSLGGQNPNDHIDDPELVLEESDSYSSTDGNMQEDRG
jgi:hypothetical protein